MMDLADESRDCPTGMLDEDREYEEQRIADKWGIDTDVAQSILEADNEALLSKNMVIFDDGEVVQANDEDDLKAKLLKIINEYMTHDREFAEIAYIFKDGEIHDLLINVEFEKQKNLKKL